MIPGKEMITANSIRTLPLRERIGLVVNTFRAENGMLPDALIDQMVVSGDEQTIATRLRNCYPTGWMSCCFSLFRSTMKSGNWLTCPT